MFYPTFEDYRAAVDRGEGDAWARVMCREWELAQKRGQPKVKVSGRDVSQGVLEFLKNGDKDTYSRTDVRYGCRGGGVTNGDVDKALLSLVKSGDIRVQ